MTTVARWVLVGVLTLHGLLHLLGVVKGFGWAQVAQLTHPIGAAAGTLWLIAALAVLASAGFLAAGGGSWWWALALGAAAISQAAVVTSCADAKAGTVVNVVLVVAAVYGFAAAGPTSFGAQWAQQATALATFHGRIRGDPGEAWMPFTGRQVTTFGPRPQRAFLMDATRSGLPVTVLHQYVGAGPTMR